MDIKNTFKNEYVFSIITRVIGILVSFVYSVVIARYLGSALQGMSTYISSVIAIGSIIVTFGMHQSYPYFRIRDGKDSIFHDFVSLTILVYSTYVLIALLIVFFVPISFELKAASLLVPFAGYANVMEYIYLVENPNSANRWALFVNISNLAIVTLMWKFIEHSNIIVVICLAIPFVFSGTIYTVKLHVFPKLSKRLWKLLIDLVKFGIFPMVALLLTALNYKVDVLMLKAYPAIITGSMIGVYGVGMYFADKVALIPDTLKSVLVSKLSKGAKEDEVAKVCRISFFSSIIIFLGLIVVGEPFINIIYGEQYYGAYGVVIACAWGSAFVGYFKLISQYNIVQRKQIRNVLLLSLSVVINVVFNILLIPRLELVGAAIASGIGYFVSGIIFVVWFARSNNIKLSKMFLIQKEDIAYVKSIVNRGGKKS